MEQNKNLLNLDLIVSKEELLKEYSEEYLKEINIVIEEEYEEKEISENKFVLIRHGLSEFNMQYDLYKHEHGEEALDKEEAKIFKFDKQYIDSPLHKLGYYQANFQSQYINKSEFKYVFLSPLLRVIQTTILLFRNHPQKQQIKFVIMPSLSEGFNMASSVSTETMGKIKEYFQDYDGIKIDYSLLEKMENNEYFQIQQFEDAELRKMLMEKIKNVPKENYVDEILKELSTTFPKSYEAWKYLAQRAERSQKNILTYLEQNWPEFRTQNEKICIVAHAVFLKFFSQTKNENGDIIVQGKRCRNCHLTGFSF